MRLLFLSQLVPYPLDAGPKVRSYYVLRHLAEAGHAVTLLAFAREGDGPEQVAHLLGLCEAVHTVPMHRSRGRDAYHLGRSLIDGQPFLIARDRVAAMSEASRRMAATGDFDAIHADQLWMAPYALEAASVAPNAPRLVLDQHNATFIVPRRMADQATNLAVAALFRREARLMARFERDACRQFDEVIWVTEEDQAAVGLPAGPRQTIIPIGVDPEAEAPIERVTRPQRVTFLGGLHWPPNAHGIVWLAREVWPRLWEHHPEAVLTVIGKSPPQELRDLPHVEVTGYVTDPTPYLQETAAFIVPLHAGGGMRVKILDAWAWGLPVVSTAVGAEGIVARDGDNALIADRPAEFAAAVGRLLEDQTLGAFLATRGRETVCGHYNVRRTYAAWDAVYPPSQADARGGKSMEADDQRVRA